MAGSRPQGDAVALMGPDEYLVWEQGNEGRHEYLGGRVYALSGASRRHGAIVLNAGASLLAALRGKACRPYTNDIKVRIQTGEREVFYYPDVVVTCDPTDLAEFYVEKPALIIEVLSPSTESPDRREKFFAYTSITCLQAYVLLEQEEVGATVFLRETGGWRQLNLSGAEAILRVEAIGWESRLGALFEGVA